MADRTLKAFGPASKSPAHIQVAPGLAACGRDLSRAARVRTKGAYVVCPRCEAGAKKKRPRIPRVEFAWGEPVTPSVSDVAARGALDRRCRRQQDGLACRCADLGPGQNSAAHRYGVCRAILAAWIAAGDCQCCGRPLGASWVVDHCHTTGFARGVVCRRCNIALAYIEDETLVGQARAYLLGTPTPAAGTKSAPAA